VPSISVVNACVIPFGAQFSQRVPPRMVALSCGLIGIGGLVLSSYTSSFFLFYIFYVFGQGIS